MWSEREISIPASAGGTARLAGTLAMPDGAAPCPGLLIIPGSGPTDRDGNSHLGPQVIVNDSIKLLASGLAEVGIASLRIDKRGVGASRSAASSEAELRFEGNVADALLWLGRLAEEPRLTDLHVAGHSEGATVATMAAARHPVAGLVLIAGPGEPAGAGLRRQIARHPPPPPLMQEIERVLGHLEAGALVPDAAPELAALFRPSVQPYVISWLAIDPVAELGRVSVPVLICQGDRDSQVSVEDAERLAGARPGLAPVIIAGMNHVLKIVADEEQNRAAYADPTLPVAPALIRRLAAFIRDQARMP